MTTSLQRSTSRPTSNSASIEILPSRLGAQVAQKFAEKYGIMPSREFFLQPIFIQKLSVAKRATTAPAILFSRLEQLFLDDDLRRCFPPLGDNNLPQDFYYYYYNSNTLSSSATELELASCVQASNLIPNGVHSIKASTIKGPITLQIVNILEIGISCAEQLRRIEEGVAADDGGGGQPKRRVVREIPTVDEGTFVETAQPQTTSFQTAGNLNTTSLQYHVFTNVQPGQTRKPLVGKSTCKVLFQDPLGRAFWGLELKPIQSLEVGLKLGTKVTLTNITMVRGVFLLKPTSVVIHGGSIESWNVNFRSNLIDSLSQAIGMPQTAPPPPPLPPPPLPVAADISTPSSTSTLSGRPAVRTIQSDLTYIPDDYYDGMIDDEEQYFDDADFDDVSIL
ncbi:hypothetical protein V1514DRAFT_74161 [Lipomyces japonicus]|uniref:uncharacterized protein n=1 Tax=Lipomyces japonicus TaxID=56871 RepID=UPI0034CFB9FB